jgi:hypothetical protein
MKNFFKLFGFLKQTKNADDIKVITDYLKKNENFKKAALDIHRKKENAKTSFFGAIDDLLEQEDGIKEKKQIEDKSNNNKKV